MAEPKLSVLGRIVSVLLGLLMLIVVGEIGLRLLGYGAIFDVYSKPSIFWIYDPVLGWRHEPNSKGVYVGPRPWPTEFRAPVEINSLGLRGPELEKLPPGGYRVLALGDSLTAAFEVPYEETFLALLQQKLTARLGVSTQIVNAGVRGYGTDQSYLYYRERGRHLEPDLVLLYMAKNDLRNNIELHRMRRPFSKAAFALRPDGSLELLGSPVAHYPICSAYRMSADFEVERFDTLRSRLVCWLQIKLFDHSALFTFVAMVAQQSPELLRSLYFLGDMREEERDMMARNTYPRELTTRLIRELAREVRLDGSLFLLLDRRQESSLLDLDQLAEDDIRVVEVDAVFGDDPTQVRFLHDSHWNSLGHQRLADLLAPILEERLRSRPPRSSALGSGARVAPAAEEPGSVPAARAGA